jgi:hypothetical protein
MKSEPKIDYYGRYFCSAAFILAGLSMTITGHGGWKTAHSSGMNIRIGGILSCIAGIILLVSTLREKLSEQKKAAKEPQGRADGRRDSDHAASTPPDPVVQTVCTHVARGSSVTLSEETMDELIFQQDRQLASEKFVLRERTLLIVGRVPSQREIPLANIAPDYLHIERRFHRGYLVPLFLAAVCAVGAWRLYRGDHESMVRASAAALLGFMALIFPFLMTFTPVEGARFVDRDGNALFEIFQPSKAAYTYDQFLSSLVLRVREAATKRPVS